MNRRYRNKAPFVEYRGIDLSHSRCAQQPGARNQCSMEARNWMLSHKGPCVGTGIDAK